MEVYPMLPYQVAHLGAILCINLVILLRPKIHVKFESPIVSGGKIINIGRQVIPHRQCINGVSFVIWGYQETNPGGVV